MVDIKKNDFFFENWVLGVWFYLALPLTHQIILTRVILPPYVIFYENFNDKLYLQDTKTQISTNKNKNKKKMQLKRLTIQYHLYFL